MAVVVKKQGKVHYASNFSKKSIQKINENSNSKSPLCPFQDEKIVSTKLQIIHVIEAECNSVRLSGDDIWKANLWELQLREKKKTKKDS